VRLRVVWDPVKAESNWRKHGFRFEEARTIFYDPLLLVAYDGGHSVGEDRFVGVGATLANNVLVVVYTVRDDEAWIISARPASRAERKRYMEGDRVRDGAAPAAAEEPEYDFSNATRGLHTIKPRGPITVEIDAVVAEFFRDAQSVNDALRKLIVEGRSPEPLAR
jgi:uncharacterized protein